MRDKLYYIVIGTLSAVLLSVIVALLYGLYDNRVDNEKIFAILQPAFQTIVGCFVGLLGGRFLNDKTNDPNGTP